MNYVWLHKNGKNELILFFNGWGMDENVVRHLNSNNYDVLTVYDYANLKNFDKIKNIITDYQDITIIAWSMGVWAAAKLADYLPELKTAIAINGTLKPIDDNFGIPSAIYQGTLDNLSEAIRDKFFRRMFIKKEEFNKFLLNSSNRNIDNQKEELTKLQGIVLAQQKELKNIYNKVFIADKDKIIPTDNQKAFWADKADIIEIESGHYPFCNWQSWDEIIS
ncbi:MAG: DUF452 family protein [Candidatus Gastranaerophilales bacterium]|nr:DUF452 family protein [Candidatus Gastranaerophilales bacterium]